LLVNGRIGIRINNSGSVTLVERRPIFYSDALCRKGKKYSLPAPKGGKHAVNPLLAVDQPQAQQRVSKKALARNNPLDPDYISGSSPFVVKARSFD
jgi:RNA-binding protein NOB1